LPQREEFAPVADAGGLLIEPNGLGLVEIGATP